jgi:hypothetical protein
MTDFAAVFILSVGCIYLCGQLAERRGRPPKLGLWLGIVLGPIALAWVAMLSPRKELAV